MIKGAKSRSAQILAFGALVCTIMAIVLGYASKLWSFDFPLTLITIFGGGFVAIVTGNKVRDSYQARNNTYFDETDQSLKKAQ